MSAMTGNTAWPEALPTVHDLDHSAGCDTCQASDSTTDLECGDCGRAGDALVVRTTYSTVTAHCPLCGAEHDFPNDHDDELA